MILELRNVTKVFGAGVRAVDDVTLDIAPGSTFGLLGESGSGKSTLARIIPRLTEPTSGDILFEGTSLLAKKPHEVRAIRAQIQMVFQNPYSSLNPRMTVQQLVGEPLIVHKRAAGKALAAAVAQMLDRVGLRPEHANRFPHEFSGGQRQRIGIARALILQPRLLILDEPTSALDVSVQAQVLNLLISLQREFHLTYLLITHDLSVVRYMCDQVALMYLGAIVEQGSAVQIFSAPRHPYTQTLLSNVPSTNPAQRMLDKPVLNQDIFSAPWNGQGCRFSPRCPAAQIARCKIESPALREIEQGHSAACHLAE